MRFIIIFSDASSCIIYPCRCGSGKRRLSARSGSMGAKNIGTVRSLSRPLAAISPPREPGAGRRRRSPSPFLSPRRPAFMRRPSGTRRWKACPGGSFRCSIRWGTTLPRSRRCAVARKSRRCCAPGSSGARPAARIRGVSHAPCSGATARPRPLPPPRPRARMHPGATKPLPCKRPASLPRKRPARSPGST